MGRVALVTGAGRGIGRAICERLAAEGHRVAGLNVRPASDPRPDLAMPLVACDVADRKACARAVAQVEAQLGPVDILVNNAGVTRDAMLHKMEPDEGNSRYWYRRAGKAYEAYADGRQELIAIKAALTY